MTVPPVIVFGAFDRHNFGDLLFPHIASALLPKRELHFAGLAERDLRPCGGHRVAALARLAREWGERRVDILHAGGEVLGCDAWEAAVMLQAPEQAQSAIALHDAGPDERLAWAARQLGVPQLAPYTVPRVLFPGCRAIAYAGVGGVELAARGEDLRREVLANLREADFIGVRDELTRAELARHGVAASLMPDPAVMAAELFGERIGDRQRTGQTAQATKRFPRGYIAVQFSADFGDDATLAEIAAQLDQLARETGLGIVFFRAGAAPWHDQLDCYRRTDARMKAANLIFESLDLWDICALVARSCGYCGSSLHGRIVATAFARPHLNLLRPGEENQPSKQTAYAATWEPGDLPHAVGINGLARGMAQALAADPAQRSATAARLCAEYRQRFRDLAAKLD